MGQIRTRVVPRKAALQVDLRGLPIRQSRALQTFAVLRSQWVQEE